MTATTTRRTKQKQQQTTKAKNNISAHFPCILVHGDIILIASFIHQSVVSEQTEVTGYHLTLFSTLHPECYLSQLCSGVLLVQKPKSPLLRAQNSERFSLLCQEYVRAYIALHASPAARNTTQFLPSWFI